MNELFPAVMLSTVNLPLDFKAKHLFLMANTLKEAQASLTFTMLAKIKAVVSAETSNDDILHIEATPMQIFTVMDILGGQVERDFANSNREIKIALVTQLTTLSESETESDVKSTASALLAQLGIMNGQTTDRVNFKISEGKTFVLQ